MTHDTYSMLENYMSACMTDSAHDKEHVFRVLYNALDISWYEKNTDLDVLVCAFLLHDNRVAGNCHCCLIRNSPPPKTLSDTSHTPRM